MLDRQRAGAPLREPELREHAKKKGRSLCARVGFGSASFLFFMNQKNNNKLKKFKFIY